MNNSRGKRSSIPPYKTRPDSPVPTLQGPCGRSQNWRGSLRFQPPLEMRPSSIATIPVESRESPPSDKSPWYSLVFLLIEYFTQYVGLFVTCWREGEQDLSRLKNVGILSGCILVITVIKLKIYARHAQPCHAGKHSLLCEMVRC